MIAGQFVLTHIALHGFGNLMPIVKIFASEMENCIRQATGAKEREGDAVY